MGSVHTLPAPGTPEWIELQQARERRAAAEAYAAARDRIIAQALSLEEGESKNNKKDLF